MKKIKRIIAMSIVIGTFSANSFAYSGEIFSYDWITAWFFGDSVQAAGDGGGGTCPLRICGTTGDPQRPGK